MQSAMEGRSSQNDEDLEPQEGLASEDRTATDSGEDDIDQSFDLLNLNMSETMEDEEPLQGEEEEEEEEFLVLDPEHPLVRRQQAALNKHLREKLERLDLELKEKLAAEKAEASLLEEKELNMYRVQQQLATLHKKMDEQHQNRAQAEKEYREAQDRLEAEKKRFDDISSQHSKAKERVSQLQAEVDTSSLHVIFAQRAYEEMQSSVKALKTTTRKTGDDKSQAAEQKLKQDLYVDHLTRELERLTEQAATYEAQTSALAEEKQAAKQAHAEVEMEMESLLIMRKQLLQLWNSSVMNLNRRDEDLCKKQESVRTQEEQVIFLDKEIEDYRKSTADRQKENETLTLQLNVILMDVANSRILISERQSLYKTLQEEYSTCTGILRESENTLRKLKKETESQDNVMEKQRRQLEKENALRLELEDKIMNHIQQELTHNNAAKYSKKLINKRAEHKNKTVHDLRHVENELAEMELESNKVREHLKSLSLTQEALNDEIMMQNKLLMSNQEKIESFNLLIEQKAATIVNYKRKIAEILASTGNEDLSPLQIKIKKLKTEIEELDANIKNDQQLWTKRQTTLVELTKEVEANSQNMLKLQIELTVMQQKKIQLNNQIAAEHQEQRELEKNTKMLRGDLVKLNSMLSKKGELSQALEKENVLMESDYLNRLKEAERKSVEIQMSFEKTQEEKERLLNSLEEADRQIKLWEKKIQLAKETRSALGSEGVQGEIQTMKAEIHRMEVQLKQLMRRQEQLLRESEATVARKETILNHSKAMVQSSRKQITKAELGRQSQGLRRQIKEAHKHLDECEKVIKDQEESQANLVDQIAKQKQKVIKMCSTIDTLKLESDKLKDTKARNLAHLVALQSRTKKLALVSQGRYKTSSTVESVGAAMKTLTERVHATSTVLQKVFEECPEYQETIRRLMLALAAYTQEPGDAEEVTIEMMDHSA